MVSFRRNKKEKAQKEEENPYEKTYVPLVNNKFSQFSGYAQQKASQQQGFKPLGVNPYENSHGNGPAGGDPYGGSNPYGGAPGGSDPYRGGNSNPYASGGNQPYNSGSNGSPYSSDTYGNSDLNKEPNSGGPSAYGQSDPYLGRTQNLPYGSGSRQGSSSNVNSYGQGNQGYNQGNSEYNKPGYTGYGQTGYGAKQPEYEETYEEYKAKKKAQKQRDEQAQRQALAFNANGYDVDDLNAPTGGYDADDLNAVGGYNEYTEVQAKVLTEEEQRAQESDEELEDITDNIKFTRDKSLASTERTLRMGEEALQTATNTIGMLGNQAAQLSNTSNQLNVAHTQNRLNNIKGKELEHASKLIRGPKNPFNSKSRLRKKDDALRQNMYSEQQSNADIQRRWNEDQRQVTNALKEGGASEPQSQYTREQVLQQSRRYIYDEDDEEEVLKEMQLNANINKMGSLATRLKDHAQTQGRLVEKLNKDIKEMHEKMNSLQVQVEVNTNQLSRVTGK